MSRELKEIIAATQNAFREDPQSAKATFTSSSRLGAGFRSTAKLREIVNAHCPVLDIMSNPVPVAPEVVHEKERDAAA
jgi:hypothetical protein